MPLYAYQAIDSKGKKKNGLIDAHSEKDARSRLRDQGVMVASIEMKQGAVSKENMNGDQLLAFTMQLAQLVGAGVPIYESLIALEEQCRHERYHRILLSLCEQIKAGKSLSAAMEDFPATFDKLYYSMIRAGESSGSLDVVLEKLAELLAKQYKLRKDIMTAMIYPGILAGFCLVLIIILLGFVVPMIEGIFQGRELNAFTAFVMGLSHAFRAWWWVYVPVVFTFATWAFFRLRTPEGKSWLERQLLKIPVIKTLMVQAAIARFTRTMGTLLNGGMTMIDSLKIARNVMLNETLEKEVRKAEGKIIEGSSLSKELSKSEWIPQMVSRMLAVGEDSGTTVVMLNKIADIYEENLEKTLDRLMALAQPIILIFMGLVIGTVLLAILLPLADMSSFSL
ncbi:General secretion pathway protein F [Waddlia chondrophila 2032/99]|uniref:General secretion pathway protein F n=2 Tax=Waddlia chondrophila TaxID=71667 RepID=F8LDS5_9BACT|nr:type II secretion system F family protein [Waddlia chondrophila]ADI39249.1 putative general secretion pathway protein F [Waddlia chondrophila WSU 86-1044]CCB91639.1 General secretion pathway protein F [Waddlia chondrophila 2032/99]